MVDTKKCIVLLMLLPEIPQVALFLVNAATDLWLDQPFLAVVLFGLGVHIRV